MFKRLLTFICTVSPLFFIFSLFHEPPAIYTHTPVNIEVVQPPKITIQIERTIYIFIDQDEVPEDATINDINRTDPSEITRDTMDISLPYTSGIKSYMSFKAITNKSSPQYQLQQLCSTDSNGLRVLNGRYVIAVGTAVGGKVGDNIDLILENGTVIPCVIGDYKSPIHTDENNLISINGCASEFICDVSVLNKAAKYKGDVSCLYPGWNSRVVEIRREL